MNAESSAPQADNTSSSEENPDMHDVSSNESDIVDAQSTTQVPSSHHDSVYFHMPDTTERIVDISQLCNPDDEERTLRQPHVSDLFGDNLSPVIKRSWAKDSTCERVRLL